MPDQYQVMCYIKGELRKDQSGIVSLYTFMRIGESGEWIPLLDPAQLNTLTPAAQAFYSEAANGLKNGETVGVDLPPSSRPAIKSNSITILDLSSDLP